MKQATLIAAVAVTAVMASSSAASAAPRYELPSVMVIAKSSNKNEVRYAAAVDEQCAPATNAPMRPYWLMRERGDNVTEGLTSRERKVLGIARQEVDGDAIRFVVNGMATRTFVAHVGRDPNGVCSSSVETTIAGTPARLVNVFVKQSLFGVDYVQLTGRTADGKTVNERLQP